MAVETQQVKGRGGRPLNKVAGSNPRVTHSDDALFLDLCSRGAKF